jgi:4-amino-4-deoxy-L-arabinose transferase-like glycosyltransferase
MATATSTRDAGVDASTPSPRRSWPAIAVIAALVAGIALLFTTSSALWLDEVLSVNIARLPLSQLHAALRHDGAPPLYYALLHVWIQLFGTGDAAVRSLSAVFSIVSLPLAWYAGLRLGGRRLAWLTLLVVATSPYAIRYGTEARMYSLVMLLVLAGYLAVLRAVEEPSLGRLACVAVATALLVYTQYWCFYLVAVAGALLLWQSARGASATVRASARRAFGAVVVGGLTFIPWVPTFLYQARHTGTPWGDPRVPWSSIAEALGRFGGDANNGETFILIFVLLTLVVLAVFGRGADERTIELDVRTQPRVRREAILAFGTLVLGTTVAFVSGSAFDARYASVMFPFFALLVAVGITLFLDRRLRAAVLAVVVLLGLAGGIRNYTTDRTQAAQVASIINAQARPGDVIAFCPDQIAPSASRLIHTPPGVAQVAFADTLAPSRIDWVDYKTRVQAASANAFASALLRQAGPHTIWYVSAFGINHLEGKCERVGAVLQAARPHGDEAIVQDDSIFEYMGLTIYRG